MCTVKAVPFGEAHLTQSAYPVHGVSQRAGCSALSIRLSSVGLSWWEAGKE